MKYMKALAVASVALLAVGLTACSSPSGGGDENKAGSGITIGGVAPNAYDSYWITLMCGATHAAADAGATMNWKAAQNADTTVLAANYDAVALSNPSGVIVTGDPTLSAKTATVMSGGTPVIAVNSPMDPATQLTTILSDSDNTEFAKFVAKEIGGKGTVGILAGIAGFDALVARYQPLIDQLADIAPDVKVLKPQYDDFDRTKAATVTSSLILANPDLKAVYAVSGPEGEGAAAAIQQAGKQGDIQLYTYDATPEVITGLHAGTVNAVLAQSPYLQGQLAVKSILDYLDANPNGGPVAAGGVKETDIPLKILTPDNIDDPDSQAYVYSLTCK
jgi:ABC-type sugar transport system substrate-binding protein